MRAYYADGAVTVYHGDCREVLHVLSKRDRRTTSRHRIDSEDAVVPWVFRVRQAAEVASVSEQLLRKLIRSRRLAVVRIGRSVRIPRGELLRLCGLEDHR